MATISDVARIAHVSVSTVSHVINGTKPVSDATRARVEDAIKRVKFSPNRVARSLRSGRTNSIGLAASDTTQYVFGQMIAAVEREARSSGQTLLLANSSEDREQELTIVRTLLERRVDGIVIAPVADSDPETLESCRRAACPVVLIDRTFAPGFDQVGIDNRVAMRALTTHLIESGHTDIALIAGDRSVWTLAERSSGFREAMDLAKLPIGVARIIDTDPGMTDGREAIEAALSSGPLPDAVVAASGLLTLGALRAFRNLDLTVPADIAFASFDGVMNSEFFEPKLTSAQHPVNFIGSEAMKLLRRRIEEPDTPAQTVTAQATLEHGTSCGCGGLVPLASDPLHA